MQLLPMTILVLLVLLFCAKASASDTVISFGGPAPVPQYRDRIVDYRLDPARERYFIHLPSGYSASQPHGLMVFIDAGDTSTDLPQDWKDILDRRKILYVAPQGAGNSQSGSRRMGLAVLAAIEMQQHYNIDRRRIYIAGFSGGARIASLLAFHQPDIFRGTVQICGSDFYRAVPAVHRTSSTAAADQQYGLMTGVEPTKEQIQYAKSYVRFALITGSGDFRHGNILDIAEGGFVRDGFRAKVFDIAGMGHTVCDGHALEQALDYLSASY